MTKNKRGFAFQNLFLLSWAAFCTLLFFIYSGRVSVLHTSIIFDWKSFFPKLSRIDPLIYSTNLIGAFIGAALFSLACISFGAIFISLLAGRKNNDSLIRPARPILIASAFLIGSGVFSIIFLGLSSLAKMTPITVIVIACSGSILGSRSLLNIFKRYSEEADFNIFERDRKGSSTIYWLSIGIVLFSLMYSSSRLSYDSVALYFSDAKITAMTGAVRSFSNDSFVVSSFHTGIQYAALIQVFGDQAARIYSWVNGVIIIIFALALGQQVGLSKQARRILLALLLTTIAFTDLLGDGKIDLATSAYAIAAVYWLAAKGINGPKGNHSLVGFLAGFAIISRPFNAILLGIFFVLYYLEQIYSSRKEDAFNLKSIFKQVLWLLIALLGLALFHLAANWMILGDPIAPFTNASKLNSTIWQWSFDPDQLWIVRILYPFTVTFLNSPQSLGTITPLFVSFLPGILIKDIRENLFSQRLLIILTSITMITLLLWITLFFTVVEIRYVFFLWIILFLPLAVIAENIIDHQDITGKIMELILIAVLVFVNIRVVYISLDTYSPIDSQGNPNCSDHIFCDYLKSINKSAGPGERVLTLSAYRYYLRSDLFMCSTQAFEYKSIREASLKGSNIFWEEVYRQGYTYIAYEKNYSVRHLYMDFIPIPQNKPTWMDLELISGNPQDNVVAYRIQVHQPPISKSILCVQNENALWEVQNISSK